MQAGKLSKGDRLGPADHASIDYAPFRRNFYIEVPELARMTDEQVAARRKDLDGLKVRADMPNADMSARAAPRWTGCRVRFMLEGTAQHTCWLTLWLLRVVQRQ